MDRTGSSELIERAGSRTPDETSESVSMSERSVGGVDTSSKGSASPSKSLCSSTSTSAENVGESLEMKVSSGHHPCRYWLKLLDIRNF